MHNHILKYIKNTSANPIIVDRLIVSAFIKFNKIAVRHNQLIQALLLENEEVESFICAIKKDLDTFTLEDLIQIFEFVISPSDKLVNGSVYTPHYIRKGIISHCLNLKCEVSDDIKIADISCGCGGFLLDIAKELHSSLNRTYYEIFKENIYGIDIQDYSIDRAKILLSLLAIMDGEDSQLEFNLWTANSLTFDFKQIMTNYKGFDIIVGNPPYVCARNIDEYTKTILKQSYEVCAIGNPDLYIPFFWIAAENLNENGVLGYITMNSFLKSLNGRKIRKYFQEAQKHIEILDFRGKQIFKKRSTYTCLFFLLNRFSENIEYAVNEDDTFIIPTKKSVIPYSALNYNAGWNLNGISNINRIENVGTPIGVFCSSRHGIATLSNNTYIFSPIYEDNEYYYLVKNDNEYKIEKNICRHIINSNKFNSEILFNDILEIIIYPYNKINGKIEIIDEFTMANRYPYAYSYLCDMKETLLARDKGKAKNYPVWYAYGRTQSLIMPKYKLFFPKIANKRLRCQIVDDSDLLLYNGMAFVNNNLRPLLILQKFIESDFFWSYVTKNSKPYTSGYYSLNGNNIKKFGIPFLTEDQCVELLSMTDHTEIEDYIVQLYQNYD